jgi:hypothetical protein
MGSMLFQGGQMIKKSYLCDECNKVIIKVGDLAVAHIRILKAEIRESHGIFTPIINSDDAQYEHHEGLHFCSPDCLKDYFKSYTKKYQINIWKEKTK